MIRIDLGKAESKIVKEFYDNIIKDNPINYLLKEISNNNQNITLYIDLIKALEGSLIENTQKVIIAKPSDLRRYIEYFESKYSIELSKEEVRKTILSCFYYSKYSKWKAYELANNLSQISNIKVCPYCNRNYISVFGKDNSKGRTRMKFDHYYDKVTYPYLALSFYNLIPSCNVCNSDLKGKKNFYEIIHIHPYEDNVDKLKFKLDIKNVKFIYQKSKEYEIDLNIDDFNTQPELRLKVDNHINTFKIKKLYNFHKDITNEIINKFYVYNEDRIDEIFNSFDGKLFSSKTEVRAMIFGSLLSDNIRPFSKLTEDIIEDLSINYKFFDEI
ncbi:hypothetical protein ACTS9D_07055 [Empedobacter brevis]